MTLAAPRGIDFPADTAPEEALIRLQEADAAIGPDVIVLTDPDHEGRLTGFVSMADLSMGAASALSGLPMSFRPVIRADEAITDVARLLLGHGMRHLPVVDSGGRYLGEILRSDVSEAVLRMLGFNRAAEGSLHVLQTMETGDHLKEILACADSAGVRVLGFSELWPELGLRSDTIVDPEPSDGGDGSYTDGAEAFHAADPKAPAEQSVRTFLLHLDASSIESMLSALRRKGYFPVSISSDREQAEAEISERIDQFLHFLTI